jgi:urease accessory protein UreF
MIFDKDYMEYLKSKQKISDDFSIGNLTSVNGSAITNLRKTYDSYLFANANKNAAVASREKKLQSVQYECIKRKLKEHYEKKVNFLTRRLTKKAQMDPHLLLLNTMTDAHETYGDK